MTLSLSMSRASQGHNLYKLCRAPFHNASKSGHLVLEKNNFEGFCHYGHGGHLGHVTWTGHLYNSSFPLPKDAPYEVRF